MEDRWAKLEEIVRRVVREELAGLGKKKKPDFANGEWLNLTEEQMKAWRVAYGSVDIEAELKKAAAWIVSNPHLAPKREFGRFLNTWLAKTQDRLSIRSIPNKQEVKEIHRRACAYCSLDAVGTVNAINHCRTHYEDAYYEKPRRMLGVVPKPVAGSD